MRPLQFAAVAFRQCTGDGLSGRHPYTAAGCTSPVIQTLAPLCGTCLRVGCGSPQHWPSAPVLEGNRSFWQLATRDNWPTGLFGDFPIPG
ncbi:MAG: hypothetical protein PHE17_20370, partial [Thiothrix sp.]|nr:hypothetical protein [Thiothrix sp.]